ncbi:serine/threonine-protein kinase 36 [Gouania willdenowi]|uniref:serine/threonine-protein kinase 36 n=1 Tax=Gouania willdenowi TaxID=441366 RepID=UPI001055E85F|nr:uncharacterized protein LOC114475978 [Gouania willdenowi]
MDSYTVLELVGKGSFGRVYRGRNKHTLQVVALKFIKKRGLSQAELKELKKEINIMTGLQHPNIVQLYDSFETQSEVVIVTEFVKEELFHILEENESLPERVVQNIACQLVSALYYLHSHRIIHRDLKPQNILLGKGGVVKLCDFGFSRAMSDVTMVLTSIKGTPLYMSPELVEEKPYDHTADLWALGCILYELHTGVPPFYCKKILNLLNLIIKSKVTWPQTMSEVCTNFLKGLLTKDPLQRLSWPDLLHHPFVADGVTVVPDVTLPSPLTVSPSPNMLIKKLKQAAEKSAATAGKTTWLQRLQKNDKRKETPSAKENTNGVREGGANCDTAATPASASPLSPPPPPSAPAPAPPSAPAPLSPPPPPSAPAPAPPSAPAAPSARAPAAAPPSARAPAAAPAAAPPSAPAAPSAPASHGNKTKPSDQTIQSPCPSTRPKQRKPISRVGKRKVVTVKKEPKPVGGRPEDTLLYNGFVTDEMVPGLLEHLVSLMATPNVDTFNQASADLGLPHVLFDLIHDMVEDLCLSSDVVPFLSQQALHQSMIALLMYLERNQDWADQQHRWEELIKPFKRILCEPSLRALAPLSALLLCHFAEHVDLQVDVENVGFLLEAVGFDPSQFLKPPPPHGLCDGLMFIILKTIREAENNSSVPLSLNPLMFVDIWKRIHSEYPEYDFCSADGLCWFLEAVFHVHGTDMNSCLPQYCERESRCVDTLSQLLAPTGFPSPATVVVVSLSSELLLIPFVLLDLPKPTVASILNLYHASGVVPKLLQVLPSLPHSLLEWPLHLLKRMLLIEPERSLPHLRQAARFLSAPSDAHPTESSPGDAHPTEFSHRRSLCSRLPDLLGQRALWGTAAVLLNVLSHVARTSLFSAGCRLHINASVLRRALTHHDPEIRAATCRLLAHVNPLTSLPSHLPLNDVFKDLIDCLHHSYMPVRRNACYAVGNWLVHVIERQILNKKRHEDLGEEERRWAEQAGVALPVLVPLMNDDDAIMRCHCCETLRIAALVHGDVSPLLDDNVQAALWETANKDCDADVRRAANDTLSFTANRKSRRARKKQA